MFEFLALFLIFYFLFNRKKKRKAPKDFDAEVKALFDRADYESGAARDIKNFLLDLINDDNTDQEKFSEARIAQAQGILDNTGPVALYWMTHIASQLALLSAAQINGIPTNVTIELGESATAQDVVRLVVKER